MAIVGKQPPRRFVGQTEIENENRFIGGGSQPAAQPEAADAMRLITLNIPARVLAEIDAAARKLGITRKAYMLSACGEKLER